MRFNVLIILLMALSIAAFGCQSRDAMEKDGAIQTNTKDDMANKASGGLSDALTVNGPKALAGTAAKYYEFNSQHYEKSLKEEKTIFLNFYANWCPICKREEPGLFAAFEELDNPDIVGYRVNYNDGDTAEDEVELAKKFGITYQHTKIILDKNRNVALKTLEAYSKEKAIDEIRKVAA